MYYNMIVDKSTEISHARIFGLGDYFLPELKHIVFFQIYKWHIGKKEAVTEEL